MQELIPPLSDAEYEQLKSDIALNGVLVPVVVDQNGAIVDGHHRVRACKELGIEDYPVIIRTYASEDERAEDAIKLNLVRRHIDREQLRQLAHHLYHNLGWSQERIARVIGVPRRTISDWLRLQKLHQVGDFANLMPQTQDNTEYSIGTDGKRYRRDVLARNRREAERAQKLLASLEPEKIEELPEVMTLEDLKRETRRVHLLQTHTPSTIDLPPSIELHNEDFRTGMERIPDESVQLIFTDPPYTRDYIPLYEDLARLAARKLEDGGSLLCYAGHYAIPEILQQMVKHLQFWWLIADIHAGGSTTVYKQGVFVKWKPILWFVKGGRWNVETYVYDAFAGNELPNKDYHPWAQTVACARYYIRWLTRPGDVVVDPFAGSGTTLIASHMEGRNSIGFEIDTKFYEDAIRRIQDAVSGSAPTA